ncbi:MAG: PhzF family phenazine biosynthesis protein [Syntrophales bacterium]
MGLEIFQVDAFTSKPFTGNPAGVCILPKRRSERWMQDVAREMNLSETAFLRMQEDGFSLRWFTPAVEVDLCGHATLAAAHVLWETGMLKKNEQALFHTRSGLLTAERDGDWIRMNFPAEPDEEAAEPKELAKALGIKPKYVGKNRFDYLVEVESEKSVRAIKPDFRRLGAIPARGVIVTSRADTHEFDFVSRFFAPRVGVSEDPVTGSAHCCLGPFWGRRLGKNELIAYQASARGGIIRVQLAGDRIYLGGQAVTVMRGELTDLY